MRIRTRIVEFDYIRVIAIFGILICHSCFLFPQPVSSVGRYFAMTFNFLFLALSAFLFGLSWERQERRPYGASFVSNRVAKLSRSYYPYLAILFLFLYLTEGYFSWRNVATHILYLPWFDKIDGFGHLWFLSMIVICYIGCCLFTNINIAIRDNLLICSILLGGGICADYVLSSKDLPGYILPYLIAYIIVFSKARTILEAVRNIPLQLNVIQLLVINSISMVIFVNGLFDKAPFWAYLIGMICACSIFSFAYNLLRNCRPNKLVVWLSGISFEIYLVHEFFLGKYSIYRMVDNPIIGFILLIALSIIGAFAIKYTWTLISHCYNYLFLGNRTKVY